MARRTKITQNFDEAYKDPNAIFNVAGVGNITNLSGLASELGINKSSLKQKYLDDPGGFGDYIKSVQRSNALVVGSYFNSGGLQLAENEQPTRKLGRFGTKFHNEYMRSLMPEEYDNA